MHSFYGEVSGSLPCVICDASFGVIFANHSAYALPYTLKWIRNGSALLTDSERASMRQSFENDPYAIAPVRIRDGGARYVLLADRLNAKGAYFYIFAVTKGGKLASETDGRRMLTACFSPRYEEEHEIPINVGKFITYWHGKARLCAQNRSYPKSELTLKLSGAECGTVKSEPLAACLGAAYSAVLSLASSEVSVETRSHKGGFTVELSANTANSTNVGEGILFAASRFPQATAQLLLASHIADKSGFGFLAFCGSDAINLRLTVPTYDIGELGFKATDAVLSNTDTALAASLEIWL